VRSVKKKYAVSAIRQDICFSFKYGAHWSLFSIAFFRFVRPPWIQLEAPMSFFEVLGFASHQLVRVEKRENESDDSPPLYVVKNDQKLSEKAIRAVKVEAGSLVLRMVRGEGIVVKNTRKDTVNLASEGEMKAFLEGLIDESNNSIFTHIDNEVMLLDCRKIYILTKRIKPDATVKLTITPDNDFHVTLGGGQFLYLKTVAFDKDNIFGISPIFSFGVPKKKISRQIELDWLMHETVRRLPKLCLLVDESVERIFVTGERTFMSCLVAIFSGSHVISKYKNKLDTMNTVQKLTFKLCFLNPSEVKFDLSRAKFDFEAIFEIKMK